MMNLEDKLVLFESTYNITKEDLTKADKKFFINIYFKRCLIPIIVLIAVIPLIFISIFTEILPYPSLIIFGGLGGGALGYMLMELSSFIVSFKHDKRRMEDINISFKLYDDEIEFTITNKDLKHTTRKAKYNNIKGICSDNNYHYLFFSVYTNEFVVIKKSEEELYNQLIKKIKTYKHMPTRIIKRQKR